MTSIRPETGALSKTQLLPIIQLSAVLLASWSLWTLALRPLVPAQSETFEAALGVGARLVFWGIPCAVYLRKLWGMRFFEPLGVFFPLGKAQAWRSVSVTLLVSALLVMGTATQHGHSVEALLFRLSGEAHLHLAAPVFEELVFRGILLSELINWTRDSSQGRGELRLKFWGGQLAAAGVFLAMHWPGWLSHQGLDAALRMSLSIFTTGFLLGFVFANTRSIWACIFLHWLNNQLSLLS